MRIYGDYLHLRSHKINEKPLTNINKYEQCMNESEEA